jgi:hypothetical protein
MDSLRRLLVFLLLGCGISCSAELTRAQFRGWRTYRLSNGIIELEIAPDLGGRIVSYKLSKHQYLWTNPSLAGQEPPASGLGPNDAWLDWGGDKLWPAPQGWDGPEQWPGPPDAVLDGSPYQADVVGPVAVRLTSRRGSSSGVAFSRVVQIDQESTVVRVRASMTNVDSKPHRWGIWTVTQLDAGNGQGDGFNPSFRAYIPMNRTSRFEGGYRVLFGEKANPQYSSDAANNILRIHYQRRVGKVGVDSQDGWVANVDGSTGYVFVQSFRFVPGADYPDGSSCEYWTNGLGRIAAWGREVVMPQNVVENPYVVETELISPFAKLAPGEHYDFEYEWRATNIGGDVPIVSCNEAGCTSEPLSMIRQADGGVRFGGRFGVFAKGEVQLSILGQDGKPIGEARRYRVSPDSPVVLESIFPPMRLPHGARTITLTAYDSDNRPLADLARLQISTE